MNIPVVADVDVAAGVKAFQRAGYHLNEILICDSEAQAMAPWGIKRVVIPDESLLMNLPFDIAVESTGIPEGGSRFGLETINHGKHLAIISKDVDIVVGPVLKHLADRAGVVYTHVDGDQHGLLIQLLEWINELGLELLCGGKFLEHDHVLTPVARTVSWGDDLVHLSDSEYNLFKPLKGNALAEAYTERRKALEGLGIHKGYDVVEMALAMNAVHSHPDIESLHWPVLRTSEIADLLCDKYRGGLSKEPGTINCVSCLREPHGTAMGGGVFAAIGSKNEYSRTIM